MKTCPLCQLQSTNAVVVCTCGYDFQEGAKPAARPQLASLEKRFLANLVDQLVLAAICLVGPALSRVSMVFNYLSFATGLAYLLLADALPRGQSVGKRVLNLAVIDDTTLRFCTPERSILRNITRFLSLADVLFIFGDRRKRLGDWLARTSVVALPSRPAA